jgi:hypothetical protein
LPKLDKAINMILSFCTVGIAPTMNFLNEWLYFFKNFWLY